jgi:hypothetical protein
MTTKACTTLNSVQSKLRALRFKVFRKGTETGLDKQVHQELIGSALVT